MADKEKRIPEKKKTGRPKGSVRACTPAARNGKEILEPGPEDKGINAPQFTLTDDLIELIAGYMRQGLSNKDALTLADVTPETFYMWMRQARGADNINPNPKSIRMQVKLAKAVEKARIEFKRAHLENIAKAHQIKMGEWTNSAWLLERSFPDEFGRALRVEASLLEQEKLESKKADLSGLSDAELAKLMTLADDDDAKHYNP